MAVSLRHKKDQVKVPFSHKEKATVDKFASSLGVSPAELLRVYVMRAIKFNLFAQNRIILSEKDWKKVVHTLNHPPKPSKAFISAAKEFKESMSY
jgi:uncharacterized protein (DUF1778 family)